MAVSPTPHASILELKRQGDKAYSRRDYGGAIGRYSEALGETEDVVVLSNRSACYAQRRRFDKALADAERALKLQPSWPRLHHRRGHALFHLGRFNDAIRAFETGQKLDPEDRDLEEALCLAQRFTEVDPEAPAPTSQAAPPAAGSSAAAGTASTSTSTSAADASGATGTTSATPSAAAAPEAPPTGEELRQKGNNLFRSGKYSGAVKAYSEALDACPSDPKIWANRAAAQMALLEEFGRNQTQEQKKSNVYCQNSMSDLEKSLSIDPKYVKAWARKGQLFGMVGDFSKALAAYQEGLKIEPQNGDCLAGKAGCERQH